MKNFHDNQHADNRLSRCYVAIFENDKFKVSRIGNADKKAIFCRDGRAYELADKNVHIVFDSLGYVNSKHQCVYISRTPKRMWKAGLVPENLRLDYLHKHYARMEDTVEIENALEQILNNDYPSFRKACLEVHTGKKAANAFHRNFAVSLSDTTKDLVLFYKNFEVGYVDVKENQIYIGDVFTHLREQIFEATGMESIS